ETRLRPVLVYCPRLAPRGAAAREVGKATTLPRSVFAYCVTFVNEPSELTVSNELVEGLKRVRFCDPPPDEPLSVVMLGVFLYQMDRNRLRLRACPVQIRFVRPPALRVRGGRRWWLVRQPRWAKSLHAF